MKQNYKELNKSDWDRFCRLVKYERRYFFHNNDIGNSETLHAQNILYHTLLPLCDSPYTLEGGSTLIRCRPDPTGFSSNDYYKELGPPPSESARANRMSATGISMFYLADSEKTSLLETADRSGTFGVAKFKTKRDMALVDLTNLDRFREHPDFMDFIVELVQDMSKPIKKDNNVHINYVPTQIFTDYFRENFIDNQSRLIEGMRYPSARNQGEAAYVLFFDQSRFLSEDSPFELSDYHETYHKSEHDH